MPRTRTIHIVDEDGAACLGLQHAMADMGYVVRSFESVADFVSFGRPDDPDCVLLDVGRTDHSGFELQRQIALEGATVPIIFITGDGDIPMAVRAMRAGAIDFLTKPVTREALIGAIARALAKRDEWCGAQMRRSRAHELFVRLTPREREVFVHLLAGQRNKQIASALESREATIKVHRSRLMRKLEARTLTELLQVGRQLDLEPRQLAVRTNVGQRERQATDAQSVIDGALRFGADAFPPSRGRAGYTSRGGSTAVPATVGFVPPCVMAANDSSGDMLVARGPHRTQDEAAGLPQHLPRTHAINHTA
jgi:FixJ family two-component response regulator